MSDFFTSVLWRNMKFLQIWQNFIFLNIYCWYSSSCGEISDFSTSVMYWNLKLLHMTDFSPPIYRWSRWQISGMIIEVDFVPFSLSVDNMLTNKLDRCRVCTKSIWNIGAISSSMKGLIYGIDLSEKNKQKLIALLLNTLIWCIKLDLNPTYTTICR